MSKTRRIARNISRIAKDKAITPLNDNILISKGGTLSNTDIVSDVMIDDRVNIYADSILEYKNEFIGSTIKTNSVDGSNYILLSSAVAGVFIIDGTFDILASDGVSRTIKICANLGVNGTPIVSLDGQSENEYAAYITFNNKTYFGIKLNTPQANHKIIFSGFVSSSESIEKMSITNSDYITKSVVVTTSSSVGKWDVLDIKQVGIYFDSTCMTTLDDGNVFYLEMFSSGSPVNNIVTGGTKEVNNAWIINPYTMEVRGTSKFPWFPINRARCITIKGGDVLVFFGLSKSGGNSVPGNSGTLAPWGNFSRYVYRFSPKTELWSIETLAPNKGLGWENYSLAIHPDGERIVVLGGMRDVPNSLKTLDPNLIENADSEGVFFKYPLIYNVSTKTWTKAGDGARAGYYISGEKLASLYTQISHLKDNLFLVALFNYNDGQGNNVINSPALYKWDIDSYKFTYLSTVKNENLPYTAVAPILAKIGDGRVAITGGYQVGSPLNNPLAMTQRNYTVTFTSVYDNNTNTFSPDESVNIGIGGCNPFTVLKDGRILFGVPAISHYIDGTSISGGVTGSFFRTYNPDAYSKSFYNTWEEVATIPENIMLSIDPVSDTVYGTQNTDFPSDTWPVKPTAVEYSLPYSLYQLSNGDFMFGGMYGYYPTAPVYSVCANRWYRVSSNGTVTRLANEPLGFAQAPIIEYEPNKIVHLAGYGPQKWNPNYDPNYLSKYNGEPLDVANCSNYFYFYDVSTNTWSKSTKTLRDTIQISIVDNRAVLLKDGTIIYGLSTVRAPVDITVDTTKCLIRYNPKTETFTKLPLPPQSVKSYNSNALVYDSDNNRIYPIFVGYGGAQVPIVYFDLNTNAWVETGKSFVSDYPSLSVGGAVFRKGYIYFILGNNNFSRYKLSDDTLESLPSPFNIFPDCIPNNGWIRFPMNATFTDYMTVMCQYRRAPNGIMTTKIIRYKFND